MTATILAVEVSPTVGAIVMAIIGMASAALGAFIASIAPRGATGLAVLESALKRQDADLAEMRKEMRKCEQERNDDRLSFAREIAELRGRVNAAHGEHGPNGLSVD